MSFVKKVCVVSSVGLGVLGGIKIAQNIKKNKPNNYKDKIEKLLINLIQAIDKPSIDTLDTICEIDNKLNYTLNKLNSITPPSKYKEFHKEFIEYCCRNIQKLKNFDCSKKGLISNDFFLIKMRLQKID